MIEHEQAGIVYFEFESFGGNGRIQHAIFSRQGGVSQPPHDSLNLSVSVPDEKTAVYANRAKAFGLFGRHNDTVVHAHLVHGSDVARVTQANNGTWVERVDALITNEPGCALGFYKKICITKFDFFVEYLITLFGNQWIRIKLV